MTEHHTLPVGYEVEGYRILKKLGEGGFGITYLAKDLKLERDVAIKEYMPSDFAVRIEGLTVYPRGSNTAADFEWCKKSFEDEGRTLAKFDHPNIVKIARIFEANGTAYLVMEFVEGGTLEARLVDGAILPESEVLVLLDILLSALDCTHRENVYHLDITPRNVMFRLDGTPLLIDFGAARQAAERKSKPVAAVVCPGYAPYEQYSTDGNVGPWTDLYGLAALAYRCLTGVRPIDAMERLRRDPLPEVSEAAPQPISPGMAQLITKGLSVYEEDRFQSVEEWRDEWKRLCCSVADNPEHQNQSHQAQVKKNPKSKRSKTVLLGIAGMAMIVVLAAGGWLNSTDPEPAPSSRNTDVNRDTVEPEQSARRDNLPPPIVGEEQRGAPESAQSPGDAVVSAREKALSLYEQAIKEAQQGNVELVERLRRQSNRADASATRPDEWESLLEEAAQAAQVSEVMKHKLNITVSPEDAEIRLNGDVVDPSEELSSGDYRLKVSKEGYEPFENTVTLPNTSELRIDLRKYPVASIRSNVYNDEVVVNGERKGSTPVNLPLKPGNYSIKVSKEGLLSDEIQLQMSWGEDKEVWADLRESSFRLFSYMDKVNFTANPKTGGIKFGFSGFVKIEPERTLIDSLEIYFEREIEGRYFVQYEYKIKEIKVILVESETNIQIDRDIEEIISESVSAVKFENLYLGEVRPNNPRSIFVRSSQLTSLKEGFLSNVYDSCLVYEIIYEYSNSKIRGRDQRCKDQQWVF